MASAAVARPAQSLRRKDAPRPTLSKRPVTSINTDAGNSNDNSNSNNEGRSTNKRRKVSEPYVRDAAHIKRKHSGKPPSLTIHLYANYFKFDGQDGSFAYDSPMRFVIEHLRSATVPHEMLEQLLYGDVPFYDGCLIAEVHNHRAQGKDKGRSDPTDDGDTVKFSMHNYNQHVTPSPLVPYPSKARTDTTPVKGKAPSGDMPAPARPRDKEKTGPHVTTVVLFPTEQTRHKELEILANTPASEARPKKKANDSGTPSSAQPGTPSAPLTPGSQAGTQKMCLEADNFYSFQSDMLVTTLEPLYLESCRTAEESDAIIHVLQHSNHQEKAPSPKTRKRTTAEVAADDAQAAETERRMLLMDERNKPTGPGSTTGEAQGTANTIPFQRFKTIDKIRQNHEEAERAKKEEEARKSAEKKEADELAQQQKVQLAQRQNNPQMQQMAQAQQVAYHQQQRQRAHMNAQATASQQQQQQQQQQALMNAQNHAHPTQNGNMSSQQQHFQQSNQGSIPHSSPVVRQQTPMMNSSPMMSQGGFPMARTSSHGANSPPRPTSAMQHPMARQISQQQHRGSQGNTPQIPQGTPNMAQAVPNRQMSQTPRMAPGSPAVVMQQGTPNSAMMQTSGYPNHSQLTPQQMQMLEQRQQHMAQNNTQNMMPDQIQNISHMQRQNMIQRNMMQAAQSGNMNPQQMAAFQHQIQQQRRLAMMQQQRNSAFQQQNQHTMQQHAGSPAMNGAGGPIQQTPQMNHAHPQQHPGQHSQMQPTPQPGQPQQTQQPQQPQMTAQQLQHRQAQLAHQRNLQQRLSALANQYGGLPNVPQHVIDQLPPPMQQYMQRQLQGQRGMQQQQRQVSGNNAGEQVPGGQPNPTYMAALRQQQQMLGQMQAQGQAQGQMGGFGMGGGQQGQGQQQQGFNGGQQGGGGGQQGDLTQSFQAMQQALNRGQ